MDKASETAIREKLEPFLQSRDFELVNIEYVKEAGQWYLRIFVDKAGGIDLDDCSEISEYLSGKLDEDDPFDTSYFLEVSSPGAERPLRQTNDFYKAIDKHVFISTYEPVHGMKEFEGRLVSYDELSLVIEVNLTGRMKQFELPLNKVALARLAVKL